MADSKVASEDEFRFAIGESLLCFYGPSLYEAKCLLREKTIEGIAIYYIHYKGWKNTWNEWVCGERLLNVNEVNMKKMEMLKKKELESKKDKKSKKDRRSKTPKTSIEKLDKISNQEKQDQLSSKTHIDEINNAIPKHNEQLKNLDIFQIINGTSGVQLNLRNSSTTIAKKENACNELAIGEKKEYSEAANSRLIPTVNNLLSESKGKKRGQPSKTLPTKIKKEKVCNNLRTAQVNLSILKKPTYSNLIPKGNNSSSESEKEKSGQPSKTLPTKIVKKKAYNKLRTATPRKLCTCKEPGFSNLIPKVNNSSSESKGKKRGQPSKTLPTKIIKEKARNKLRTATPRKLCICKEPGFSNLIPKGNNSSSESKGKKRGQPSKTLPTKIIKEKACNKLRTATPRKLCICKEPRFSNLISKVNNSSSESKGEKRGQSSKTLPPKRKKVCKSTPISKRNLKSNNESKLDSKSVNVINDPSFKPKVGTIDIDLLTGQTSKTLISKNKKVGESTIIAKVRQCKSKSTRIAKVRQGKSKSTRIAKVRQGKSNTPNSKLAEENKGHTLIEETHKEEMPTVNMWTQSIPLETNENVPSTSQLTENIKPTFSRILIPKTEEPEIIDLTKDEEIDIKPNITTVKEGTKSVIMNFFITTQNGDVPKHIISLEQV